MVRVLPWPPPWRTPRPARLTPLLPVRRQVLPVRAQLPHRRRGPRIAHRRPGPTPDRPEPRKPSPSMWPGRSRTPAS
ncbi:hypothetical protein ACFFX0_05165 [Citricoccus parietis]|uniref:Uncharacterized protein n=1 Tax=Citricoccus parietis TaxID=592307 RepID=A0ABV5FVA0_9MICC